MLDPQRAILIKRGNALLGRYELRAALGCSRLDEFYDGLLGRAVVPRRKRVLSTSDGCSECQRANERDGDEVLPARRSFSEGRYAFSFHGWLSFQFKGSLHLLDLRRQPSAIQHSRVRPVAPDIQGERAFGRGQPVAFLVCARRLGSGI